MIQDVTKWDNSSVYQIPKAYLDQLGWQEDTMLQARVVDGRLVIEAVATNLYSLDQLLEGINAENLHNETDSCTVVCNAVW